MPTCAEADERIEHTNKPSQHGAGNEFDKVEFDRRAKALRPGQMLVARKVIDIGPRANTAIAGVDTSGEPAAGASGLAVAMRHH